MPTRDQEYARTIYAQVTKVKQDFEKGEKYKRYGVMCHKLPFLIRSAGLAQALEFVNTREKNANEQVGAGPYKRLISDLGKTLFNTPIDNNDFCQQVRNASLTEYMLLTRKALAALLWYKRFAQSILDVEASDTSEDSYEE